MFRCRALFGHDGECRLVASDLEAAIQRAFEATRELRRLEREGEKIPQEIWNMTLRDIEGSAEK